MNTATTKPRKEQQRAADTKDAILKAALSEFAAIGFDGATARGIAEKAGVNHTLITHHFGSKEDLWKATARYMFGLYADRMAARREGLEGVDDATVFRLLLREFILFSSDVPEFGWFMTLANQAGGERHRWLVDTFIKQGFEQEVGVIKGAQFHQRFGKGDADYMRFLFIGSATSIFTYASEFELLTGKNPHAEDVLEKHIEHVLRLFLGD